MHKFKNRKVLKPPFKFWTI